MSKMVQFEYDPDDGEIRPIIEFPLEDAKLTRRQICRCLHAIAQIIDKHHESIIDALSHGITPETPKANIAAYEEFLSQRRETRRRELSPVQQPISHLETSIHAPSNSTGPGTSPDNPFILKSIIECYALLNAMHMRTDHGLIKVRYDRVGPVQSNRFPYPIDHYILFESAPFSDKRLGKLMDFYMYGYGSRSMSLDLLPNGLGDMMVGSSPKEKSKMESLIDKIFGKKSDR
jgi:hypothetical protein